MRFFFILSLLFTVCISACKQDPNKAFEELRKEVLAKHDEVMPKMGELSNYISQVEILEKQEEDSRKIIQIKQLKKQLTFANDLMMRWMQRHSKLFPYGVVYDYNKDKNLFEEKRKALEQQNLKIEQVQDAFERSLNQAKIFFSRKN